LERVEWRSLEYETVKMIMSQAGIGPENGCPGEDQQDRPVPSSDGCLKWTRLQLSNNSRTDRLTVDRNMTLTLREWE
jgi:hypothetical protein